MMQKSALSSLTWVFNILERTLVLGYYKFSESTILILPYDNLALNKL